MACLACCTLRGWRQIESVLAGDEVGLRPCLIIDDVYAVTSRTRPSPPFQCATLKGQEKGLGTRLLITMFPNLNTLASICLAIPVETASVERSFSQMKMINTRLRNHLGEKSLSHLMMFLYLFVSFLLAKVLRNTILCECALLLRTLFFV